MQITITKSVRTASITRKQSRPTLQSRDDLSFTIRDGEQGQMNNWHIAAPCRMWSDGIAVGQAMFAEVKELAKYSPSQAEQAIEFALSDSREFSRYGRGEETGFARALAKHFTASLRLAKKLKLLQSQLVDSTQLAARTANTAILKRSKPTPRASSKKVTWLASSQKTSNTSNKK